MLDDIVATAIIAAKIGEEQGLDAKAKKAPTKNGNINKFPPLFWGIFFIIDGNCISITPSKFNPNITITDANIKITIGEATDVKALPVRAHIIPIMLNINDNPNEKESICINSFLLLSFEYPPTYPIIRGNIPKLQGVSDAKIPDKNAIPSNIGYM